MRGKQFLDTLLRRARELDSTRLVTLVTVMGGPQNWMQECDVICMNRYWGWYAHGWRAGQGAGRARAGARWRLGSVAQADDHDRVRRGYHGRDARAAPT